MTVLLALLALACIALYAWAVPRYRGVSGQPRWTAYRSIPGLWLLTLVTITLTGLFSAAHFANAGIDAYLHDTYYVVAHIHYTVSTVFATLVLAVIILVFEKVVRMTYSRRLASMQWAFWQVGMLMIIGADVGMASQSLPRRYVDYPESFETANRVSSFGAWLCVASLVLLLILVVEARIVRRPPRRRSPADEFA